MEELADALCGARAQLTFRQTVVLMREGKTLPLPEATTRAIVCYSFFYFGVLCLVIGMLLIVWGLWDWWRAARAEAEKKAD